MKIIFNDEALVAIRRIGAALTFFIAALVFLRLFISISRGLALTWLHIVWDWDHESLVATTGMLTGVSTCFLVSGWAAYWGLRMQFDWIADLFDLGLNKP